MIRYLLLTIFFLAAQQATAQEKSIVVIPLDLSQDKIEERVENIIVVAQTGGDFENLNDAMESIGTTSELNRYLIEVAPGEYLIRRQLIMKPYVNIKGSGQQVTKLESKMAGEMNATIIGANHSQISNISINSLSTTLYPSNLLLHCIDGCPKIKDSDIEIRGSTSGRPVNAVSLQSANEFILTNSNIRAIGAQGSGSTAIAVFMANATVINSSIISNMGIQADHDGHVRIINSTILGSFPITVADQIGDLASVVIENSRLGFGDTAITNKTNNDNKVTVHNTIFRGDILKTTNGSPSIKCVFSSSNDAEELGPDCRSITTQ